MADESLTLLASLPVPAPRPATLSCGTYSDTEHSVACELVLAADYARHGRFRMALECAWAASDASHRMKHPRLTYLANEMLGQIMHLAAVRGVSL
jgi:hypothetical protein